MYEKIIILVCNWESIEYKRYGAANQDLCKNDDME